ncbi:FHA domain-containing protein [Gloeomargaritales cyanobacterium VI4D9]|nr:FHA domain-containing protein [Gloeomargaritales cyanobacterium VI4D9]
MGKPWGWWLLFLLGWIPPVWAQKTPDQLKLWHQPTLVYLISGYQGQWRWQQRTWDTIAQTQGTGVLVHPNGQVLTLATVVQVTARGEDYGKRLLLEDLARQRLELHNQTFPQRKIPITPQNIQEAVARIEPEAQLEQFKPFSEAFLSGGKADQSYGFQVVKYDPQRNLALVTVQLTQTPTLVFRETQPPPAGSTLYALVQTHTQDKVTATFYTGTWNGQGMTFPAMQELTGAVVCLANGEVLGLAAVQGKQVNLISSTTIRQFLPVAGVENPDSPVNALWQEGLAHFWEAHYRRAQPVFQAILNRYPQHHSAQTLLTQAQERIEQGQDRSPVAWWQMGSVAVGAGIVVLGAGAVGLAIWLSRRPRPVPPVQGIPTLPTEPMTVATGGVEMTAPVIPPTEAQPTQMLTPPPTTAESEPPTQVLVPPPEPETQVITPPPPSALPDRPPPTEEYRPSRLVCIAGPAQGEEFTLVGTHYLGRDHQRCHIVIPDPQVSGQHACIEVSETHVTLRDCGSTNGTFINSVQHPRITQVRLEDQDVIILGQKGTVKFRFYA